MPDEYVVEVEDRTELATIADVRRMDFGRQLQRAAVAAESQRRLEWLRMLDDWIETKFLKCRSEHTRRNYHAAVDKWQDFLATQFVENNGDVRTAELWEVDHTHVRAWQQHMVEQNLSPVTINHTLSCVSSFYSFVIREKRMVNGIEIDLFVDRLGRTRENPFKAGNLQRARIEQYERAYPLTVQEYDQLLRHLEAHNTTLQGARNHALLMTYLHTGWRSAELLRMQWQHIRPSRVQANGTMIFEWRGKGGKHADDVLPADCYLAIVNYLKLAGRYLTGVEDGGMQPEEYIWLPVATPDMSGMANGAEVDVTQPISQKTALRVLRNSMRLAGVKNWTKFRIHDLRHTHAQLLLETGHNLAVVQARLHHSSLATTGIYAKAIHRSDPVDTHTNAFQQLRMGL